jgi:hypothetical protein
MFSSSPAVTGNCKAFTRGELPSVNSGSRRIRGDGEGTELQAKAIHTLVLANFDRDILFAAELPDLVEKLA